MNTILSVALGTIFPKENIDSILEVINATPNADVAAEILLGIYVEPGVQTTAVIADRNCKLISYDRWTGKVMYSYETPDTKHIYIHKDTDVKLITEENYETFKYDSSKDDYKGHTVILSTVRTVTQDCKLDQWNNKPLVSNHPSNA
jgi:hypothetical protein